MKIDSISIKNYRCFAKLSIALHSQLTVLVAPNGQGKTTVLDAIKVALWPYVAGFDMGRTTNDTTGIDPDDVRREQQVRAHEMEWRLPSEISAMGRIKVRRLVRDGAVKNPIPAPEGSRMDLERDFYEDMPWQGVRVRTSVKKKYKNQGHHPCQRFEYQRDCKSVGATHFFRGANPPR